MAGTKSHGSIGVQITRGELIGGLIYLPFYLYLTPLFVQFLMETFGFAVTDASLNVWVFMVNFLAIAIIFRHFLIASISSIGGHFWDFLQSIVLGFSFYFALNWVLSLILVTTNLYTESANNEAVFTLAGDNYVMVVVCAVLLAPLVEEVIFRGMFFGLMHTKSRILAYVGSTLLFAALHVWQFVGAVGWGETILTAIQYLPAGIALGWTYEKARTIWAPIIVHGLINAMAMGLFALVY